MRRCTVNSSDLAIARIVSHRMASPNFDLDRAIEFVANPKPVNQESGPVSPGRYSKPGKSDPPPADFLPAEIDSWEVLLAWSYELCQARAAFVVDAQGFVIGSRGNAPKEGFEGIGAELCFAMEQLDRIDPESGQLEALELHFGPTNILGIKTTDNEGGAFILGFVGPRAVHESVREAVHRQVIHNLHHLR